MEADDLTKQTNVTDQKLLKNAKSEVYFVAANYSTPTSVKIWDQFLKAEEQSPNKKPIPANVTYATDNDENYIRLKMSARVRIVTKLPKILQLYNCLTQWLKFEVITPISNLSRAIKI